MSKKRWYAGYLRDSIKLETFSSRSKPSFQSHGDKYSAVVGPFNNESDCKAFVEKRNGMCTRY
jgi:hypothetical protein